MDAQEDVYVVGHDHIVVYFYGGGSFVCGNALNLFGNLLTERGEGDVLSL